MAHDKNKPTKAKKPALHQRFVNEIESISEAGRETIRDPRGTPKRAHSWFRRWFRNLFKVRGGGLYALGYIVTFVYFEVTTLAGEVVESATVSGFLGAQAFDFVFRFLSDTIGNMARAFIWPVTVIAFRPPYGLAALVLGFMLFDRLVRPPLERWMLADESDVAEERQA
jgi:hypothetical protein